MAFKLGAAVGVKRAFGCSNGGVAKGCADHKSLRMRRWAGNRSCGAKSADRKACKQAAAVTLLCCGGASA